MANTILTPSVFAQEGLMHLENQLVLGSKVRADLSDQFNMVGDTINVRRPVMYLGQADNLDITSYSEDITEGKTTVTMDKTLTIPVKITAKERTLSFDRLSEEVIKPAMIRMKDAIEVSLAELYTGVYWFSGTPGTLPATFKSVGTVDAILTDAGVPQSDRAAFHSPYAALELADGLKGVFVQGKAKTALEQASIGRYANFEHYTSVHVPTHTTGAHGGTPLVAGAAQNVTYAAVKDTWSQTLNTDGWTASVNGVLKAGDIITIAGVNSVNPITKQSTGQLQTFVVNADANSGATTGPAALSISPPIITEGAYQTVSAAPADNAAITVKTGAASTAYRQSLMMHPDAMLLVSRALDIPQEGVKTSTKSGNRVTISCTSFVDGKTLDQTMRFDMLWGRRLIDPRLAARLTS